MTSLLLTSISAELAEHDKRYHQEDAPAISDADYDALKQRYLAIEAHFPHGQWTRINKILAGGAHRETLGGATFGSARHPARQLAPGATHLGHAVGCGFGAHAPTPVTPCSVARSATAAQNTSARWA